MSFSRMFAYAWNRHSRLLSISTTTVIVLSLLQLGIGSGCAFTIVPMALWRLLLQASFASGILALTRLLKPSMMLHSALLCPWHTPA
jgi:hypothetical protein